MSVLFASVTFSHFVKGLTCQSFSQFALLESYVV